MMTVLMLWACINDKLQEESKDQFVQGKVVRITQPNNGDLIPQESTLEFEAGTAINRVALFSDDELIAEVSDMTTNQIDLMLTAGTQMLTLEGLDSSGIPVSEHNIRVRVEGNNDPWTAIVSPLNGATVSNPVHFMINASDDIDSIDLFADGFALGTTEPGMIFSYTFTGTGFERTIEVVANSEGSEMATDSITITVQDAPEPISSDFNELVMDTLEDYPTDGSYAYYWPQSGGWLGNPHDIYYVNQLYAEGDPQLRSYCVGLTFEVFMTAMETINGSTNINGMSIGELDEFRTDWYVRELFGAGPADAVDNYGIGSLVSQWSDIRAGDFIQFWRNSGSGHNAIFIDWEYDINDSIIGFIYWSTQGSTDGIGYNSEYFSSVDPNHFYAARVHMPEDWMGY
ncbi:MAG: hypothetical protein VXZ96_11265 [Myxococcota bacterium]|nr:hypothetical protein [Myxococcota bacterium]